MDGGGAQSAFSALLSEREKMTVGVLYDPFVADLVAARERAKEGAEEYNQSPHGERSVVLRRLLDLGEGATVTPPLRIDYGFNIHLGADVFVDHDCIILDEAPVRIGRGSTVCGCVSLLTACHPIDYLGRQRMEEFARPVSVGSDCWIGPNVTLCPGSSVGDGSVVEAGSVVTKAFPEGSLLSGSPARLQRTFASAAERESFVASQAGVRMIALASSLPSL